MRVLHVSDRLTDRGGAYWHLLGLLDALQERGLEVHLAVGLDEGRPAVRWPVSVVDGLASRTRAPFDLGPLVRRLRPDVVHLHTVVNPAVLEWAADQPSLVTVQDHRYFCPSRGKWTARGEPCRTSMSPEACAACFDDPTYFQEVHRLTDERLAAVRRLRVHVLSHYMKRELAAAGVPDRRIDVIPPFVHGLDQGGADDGAPCVLFVGRLSHAKGARDAVLAWRRSGVDLPLLVAGTGPLRGELEAAGAEVLGWVAHSRMAGLYRRARAVLFPSRWQEPFGIAGLEAASLGTPVVAWESGGVAEWHPGPLVEWGDVDALGALLRQVVGQSGSEARPRQGFFRQAAVAATCALYESLGTSGGGPLPERRASLAAEPTRTSPAPA